MNNANSNFIELYEGINKPVTADKIPDKTILPQHLANHAVREEHLAGNSVGTTKVIDGSITSTKIAPGAVTNSKIPDGAITGSKLNAGVVSNRNLATNAVQPDNIVNNAILERHLAGKIITQSKLSDDLSVSISKTDIKIFGAIEYEEINRSKIRIKKPVQSLGYLASGGTFKWINDIPDNVELNQNESIIFNVKDG